MLRPQVASAEYCRDLEGANDQRTSRGRQVHRRVTGVVDRRFDEAEQGFRFRHGGGTSG